MIDIILNNLFIVISLIIYLIAVILLLKGGNNNPFLEWKFLIIGVEFILLSLINYIIIEVVLIDLKLYRVILFLLKSNFVLISVGISLVNMFFTFPNFQYTYKALFSQLFFYAICALSAFVNFVTLEVIISERTFVQLINPFGLFLFSGVSIAVLFSLIIRIKEIFRLSNIQIFKQRDVYILLLLLLLNQITLVFDLLSIYLPVVFASLIVLFVVHKLVLHSNLFFITDTEFIGVMIKDTNSKILYEYNKVKTDKNYEHLKGLFQSLDIDFRKSLTIDGHLEKVNYGKIQIIISNGNYFNFTLIVTKHNLVTEALSKFMLKQIENEYIVQNGNIDNIDFEKVILYLSKYFIQ